MNMKQLNWFTFVRREISTHYLKDFKKMTLLFKMKMKPKSSIPSIFCKAFLNETQV
jgi:hypothetical protein